MKPSLYVLCSSEKITRQVCVKLSRDFEVFFTFRAQFDILLYLKKVNEEDLNLEKFNPKVLLIVEYESGVKVDWISEISQNQLKPQFAYYYKKIRILRKPAKSFRVRGIKLKY